MVLNELVQSFDKMLNLECFVEGLWKMKSKVDPGEDVSL